MRRRFTNKACFGYPSLVANLGTEAPLLQRQLNDCANINGTSNGTFDQCSTALPNLFVYNISGTMTPVINYCNPTNPADPNYGLGCTLAAVINGRSYYLYYPMLTAASGASWTYKPSCTGF